MEAGIRFKVFKRQTQGEFIKILWNLQKWNWTILKLATVRIQFWMVRLSNGWDYSHSKIPTFWKLDHLKSDLHKVWISNGWIDRPWWPSGLRRCVISLDWSMACLRSQVWIPLEAKKNTPVIRLIGCLVFGMGWTKSSNYDLIGHRYHKKLTGPLKAWNHQKHCLLSRLFLCRCSSHNLVPILPVISENSGFGSSEFVVFTIF